MSNDILKWVLIAVMFFAAFTMNRMNAKIAALEDETTELETRR